jgi:hypothetical protein
MDLIDSLSAHHWFAATGAQRQDLLAQVCSLAGPGFEVIGVHDFGDNPIGRLRLGDGLVFSLIPSGTFDMGISGADVERLGVLLDDRDEQEEVEFILSMAEPYGTKAVTVLPFLIAAEPLNDESLKALMIKKSEAVAGCVAPSMLAELQVCLTPVNNFGVSGLGSLPEVCVDGEVRGGATVVFPWQGCGEWLSMLCGWTSPSSSLEYFASVRVAASLFAG